MTEKKQTYTRNTLSKILKTLNNDEVHSPHIPAEEMSAYVDAVSTGRKESDPEKFGAVTTHLANCETCLAEYFLLKNANDLNEYNEAFEPELNFLKDKSMTPWQDLKEGVWQMAGQIKMHIDQTRLVLLESLRPVQLVPVSSYAVRTESAETTVPGPTEMIIDGPNGEWKIKILLTVVGDNAIQFLLLGIQTGEKTILEGFEATLVQLETGRKLIPVVRKRRTLDFGILANGEYLFEVQYQEKRLSIPIQLTS